MDSKERRGMKRKGDGYDEIPGAKKVARKLDFGAA